MRIPIILKKPLVKKTDNNLKLAHTQKIAMDQKLLGKQLSSRKRRLSNMESVGGVGSEYSGKLI